MSKLNDLDIVYCKDCAYFRYKKVNANSAVYSCLKNNSFDADKPELYCNKPCYKKKTFKKYTQKKSTKTSE